MWSMDGKILLKGMPLAEQAPLIHWMDDCIRENAKLHLIYALMQLYSDVSDDDKAHKVKSKISQANLVHSSIQSWSQHESFPEFV